MQLTEEKHRALDMDGKKGTSFLAALIGRD
jgi:hypothetical protein